MKIVAINDIHKSAVPPVSRKSNYNECINNKLLECANFCNEEEIDLLLITGDFYHRQKPEANPYWLMGEGTNLLRKFNCTKVAAFGNHDWDEDPQRLPYYPAFYTYLMAGVHIKPRSGKVWQCLDETEDTLPRANPTGVEVCVINSDIGSTTDDIIDLAESMPWTSTASVKVACVHAPIVPASFMGSYPAAFIAKCVHMDDLDGIADIVFYGDIHDPHGVIKLANTTFVNFGSLARNSSKELNNQRQVCMAYCDTDTRDIQPVVLENVIPAVDAFRSDEITANKQVGEELDDMIETLGKTSFSVLTPDILIERIQASPQLSSEEVGMAVKVIKQIVA